MATAMFTEAMYLRPGIQEHLKSFALGHPSNAPDTQQNLPSCSHRMHHSALRAAQVLIEIIGKTATSGAVVVSSRRQGLLPFRAGCGTTTVLAKVPSVGPLVELRVTLDGSGMFPGWHLKCDTCICATRRYVAQPETSHTFGPALKLGSGRLSHRTALQGAAACNGLRCMGQGPEYSRCTLLRLSALLPVRPRG